MILFNILKEKKKNSEEEPMEETLVDSIVF